MKRLLFILLLLYPVLAPAQESYRYFDSLTYQQYVQHQYRELLSTGRKALKAGYDYYYLRMRMGIAAYELDNYDLAYIHFNAAASQNMDNTLAEYMYYSMLFSGREDHARIFFCSYQEYLPDIKETCKKGISSFYLEGGHKFSSGDIREIGDISFLHAGMAHLISPRVRIYQGYSRIKQEFTQYQWATHGGNGPGPGGPGDSVEIARDVSLVQNEYYLNPQIKIGNGSLILSPAFHYQAVQGSNDNYALSMLISQRIRLIQWRLGIAISEINVTRQQLYTAGITLYPVGSDKIYLDAEINGHVQNSDMNMIYQTRAAIRLLPRNWLEVSYGWGELYNYSDMNAFYIYNIPDTITSRFGISILSRIMQKHTLSAGYLFEKKRQSDSNINYEHRGFYLGLTILL
ncbi:hypothetical protein [Fulvivirga sedimenti]|uniref:Tetratricopeptide repeat protein n=1 Tax=Fulvivirga sedimenti TaxID=2879465 RepID=A0A9X1HJR7_9BACT|nr:hypothetical protein [Fulvivirga sedimenti]MCA6073449.1 hypothetical protein [Fulvivirga sedimenti]